ncbi:MAG: sulfatase-like hydrolase/transferase, partial [Solirubrobacterales bacterium]
MDSTIPSTRRLAALGLALLGAAAAALALSAPHEAESATGDNVIFILTDDQSASELAAMPSTQALIGGQGATFRRTYVPYPLCCPSRAGLLTGQYMHNHGVRGNL